MYDGPRSVSLNLVCSLPVSPHAHVILLVPQCFLSSAGSMP